MSKKAIIFKGEDSMWQMLADGTKTWDARKDDMSDDRIYRLHWGEWVYPPPGGKPCRQQVEDFVSFVNKTTGEVLVFRFRGIKFTDWAPGWVFIQLGGLLRREQ